MSNIGRRVAQLEGTVGIGVGGGPPRVIRIIAERHETDDDAVNRYRAEHPDVPDNALFIVRVLVSPQHGGAP